ncbi:type I polyketide synthase [Paenibacillus sp. P46E]|uniref:type I polyketide synthase n=1 Tax=Paenibacillus sp. P46E TaxID=1349436 RepID=UPI000939A090|nr:type I polyketide synthase [Paenibacillus sp. P46E]OKP97901.1 hypothetical protein A3849_13395 [Paenibacillus sp. P46E]
MSVVQTYIFEQVKQHKLTQEAAKQMLKELKNEGPKKEDIAIIGISCRLPKASNTGEYWSNLMGGLDCRVEFQKEMIEHIKPIVNNKAYADFMGARYVSEEEAEDCKMGGYLEDVDKFDAELFNISPKEAKAMDPSHRVLLETVWTAIEDAGYAGDKIFGSQTSLYVGKDHVNDTLYRYITEDESTSMTGNWPGLMAGRINYLLNLKGSSMVLDSACSSGLLGVHLACNALKNKECEMAIVSAISLGIFPRFSTARKSMMESQDDRVKTFDKNADGTFFSDGVAAVILKPLSKARQDGDNIYAVIKGSAVNNDGASNGLTAPNAVAQEEVLLKAWEDAQVDPETIQYIEAHGTGTKLGDPIEIKGLTNAFAKHTDKVQFCGIGSVKANIGHTVAVSGLASLIKVVLSMKNNVIPSSIHFKEPNSLINFIKSPVFVTEKPLQWPKSVLPRRAGINSFGFVGTNAHVVVEEAPAQAETGGTSGPEYEIFTVSAKTEKSLNQLINQYADFFRQGTETNLNNICYTAKTGRGHYAYRLALIVKSYEELKQKITQLASRGLSDISEKGVYYDCHKIGSDRKQIRDQGEITLSEHRKLSSKAGGILEEIASDASEYLILNLAEICNLYVKGARVEWNLMYRNNKRKIVSLPTYQFDRVMYWGEVKDRRSELEVPKKNINHPLIDQCLADSMDETIYSTTFNVNTHWVLSDHKIMGVSVIPGTTYLEMGRKACSQLYHTDYLELRDVFFFTPLSVGQTEDKQVHTIVKKEKGYAHFIIASQEQGGWITHAEGKAYNLIDESKDTERLFFDLDAVRNDSSKETIKVKYEDTSLSSKVFSFGPRWLNFKEVILDHNEQLVELELAEAFKGDLEELILHPSLLDNAANVFIGEDDDDSTFLPLSYKNIKIYSAMPQHFYAYVQKKSGNKETKTCDIQLIDMQGKIFVEIKDYVLKKVNHLLTLFKENDGLNDAFYRLNWVPSEAKAGSRRGNEGTVLVFKDTQGIYENIAGQLQNKAEDTIQVEFGEFYKKLTPNHYVIQGTENDYINLMNEIKDRNIRQILHLSSISSEAAVTCADLEDQQNRSLHSLFYLAKSISSNKIKENIDLVLISDNATEVTGKEQGINPLGAALFGLGTVLSQEFKNIQCRALDVDRETPVEIIREEIQRIESRYQIALRSGKRYTCELDRHEPEYTAEQGLDIKEQGVYIITGGTGGIGLEIAKYLAGKSSVHIALINRSKLPEVESWDQLILKNPEDKLSRKLKAIRDIRESGSEVNCYSCEISDLDQVHEVIQDLKGKYGRIHGIFHCAGVAGEGFTFRKPKETFNEVVNPKVTGTWVLDQATREEDLEFFILFSSINAIFGGSGQGDYAAANAYMDSFSYSRNKRGARTFAINWPAWSEVGIAVDYGITEESSVFHMLTVNQALTLMDEMVAGGMTHVIPGKLNRPLLDAVQDQLPFTLSEAVRSKLKDTVKTRTEQKETPKLEAASDVILKGKGADYSETERNIAQMYSLILDMHELDLYESFNAMGGDSIMATQLLKLIDKKYPDIVDISDIFTYSSVVELSEYIDRELNRNIPPAPVKEEPATGPMEQELRDLIENLQKGAINIQDGLKILED